AGLGRRFQRYSVATGRPQSGPLGRRRTIPAAHARKIPCAVQSRTDRRRARGERWPGPLYVLGLPGRRLATERRHPHRPLVAVAAGGRPADRRRRRQARARLGEALGSRSGLGRPRALVSRFRSSHTLAAASDANFGIKGTLATLYDSSATFEPEVRNWSCGRMRANFGFGALVSDRPRPLPVAGPQRLCDIAIVLDRSANRSVAWPPSVGTAR